MNLRDELKTLLEKAEDDDGDLKECVRQFAGNKLGAHLNVINNEINGAHRALSAIMNGPASDKVFTQAERDALQAAFGSFDSAMESLMTQANELAPGQIPF